MPKVRDFTVLPAIPDSLKDLEFIAANMFWSWNPEYEALFKRIDSGLWSSCGHNPVKLLGSVPQERFNSLAEDQGFLCELKRDSEKLREYLEQPTWFGKVCSECDNSVIAYFSAEFGIHESLPIYAGGLGILAGDHLKSASDLGVPLVGVGLLYQKGYFRQLLNVDGWQQEVYVDSDFYNMPIELVRKQSGRPLTISVEYPGRSVYAQIWRVHVGRLKLYLLDTNIDANSSTDRMITAALYGGDRELRIRQEIMLGIGGFKALAAMNITPAVCHINEGHAAFMALERIRQLRNAENMTFDQALEAAKAGNVFTLHTLVKAGLDEFSVELMDKYFGDYFPKLGINRKQFLALGRIDPEDDKESFKMPVLALKVSSFKGGVSKLHGQMSRSMWSCLWGGVPVSEIPIASVTNGVHTKTWLSEEMNAVFERYFGPNWADYSLENSIWKDVDRIPDEEFWMAHQRCKEQLVAFVRHRLKAQMQRRGTYNAELNWAEGVLDPEALTIGFARRFAGYKRANLLLKEPKRLIKLLSNQGRPVQFIFAGKAHPRDTQGKEIIREIVRFTAQNELGRSVVVLEDYDINVAKMLVRGVDVWLNNPRRPMEASGTSGMKAAINGALNISTLDGWWCEGYRPEGGWAIGAEEEYKDDEFQDVVDSRALYDILENEVVPLFYTRSQDDLPRAWIHRVKNSIKWIAPRFNTHRMVAEYTRRFYNPAAARWRYLTADACSRAKALSVWKSEIKTAWPELAIKDVQVYVNNGQAAEQLDPKRSVIKVGAQLNVRALIKLGTISPDKVSVELYHGPVNGRGDINEGQILRMDYKEMSGGNGEHWFVGSVPCKTSGRQGLALRVLPRNGDLVSTHDLGLVLWEAPAENRVS